MKLTDVENRLPFYALVVGLYTNIAPASTGVYINCCKREHFIGNNNRIFDSPNIQAIENRRSEELASILIRIFFVL